jgi:hypothetical protein
MTVAPARLAQVFVEMADTLVSDFDLIEFLRLVAVRSREIAQSTAAGLLLADPDDQLQFMAASDERTGLLELFQVEHREGPCLDSYRTGRPVVNADLAEAHGRWPEFAPAAVGAGFRSVHALPLRLRDATVGAINLFDGDTGTVDPGDIHIVQALADIATIGLLQERTLRHAETIAGHLQTALRSRIVIEQAKGAIAQSHAVTVDTAYELLRSHARRTHKGLSSIAQALVDDPASIRDLTQST